MFEARCYYPPKGAHHAPYSFASAQCRGRCGNRAPPAPWRPRPRRRHCRRDLCGNGVRLVLTPKIPPHGNPAKAPWQHNTSGKTLASNDLLLLLPPPGDPAKSRPLSRCRAAARTRDAARAALHTMRACASSWFSHSWEVSFARRRAYCAWRGPLCWRHLAGQAAASRFRLGGAWQFQLDAWTRGRLGACEQASSSQPQT
jgi:hypothetical protein